MSTVLSDGKIFWNHLAFIVEIFWNHLAFIVEIFWRNK